MKSLYKLITTTNLKSPTLAFPLIMPLVFVLLYSVGMPEGMSKGLANQQVAIYFSTILSITTMQSGLMGFGINFISLKKSVLLKRIGATELSKTDVVMAVLLFGLTLWVISVIWIVIMVVFFSAIGVFSSAAGTFINNGEILNISTSTTSASAFGWMGQISWWKTAIATLVMLYCSYGLGLFITTIAKDDQAYMGMAMLYFFFAGFIGGLMFPGDVPDWMTYIGYIVPHSYVGSLYDWVAGVEVSTVDMVLGFVIPILFGTGVTFAAIKLLKFD